MVNEVLPRSKVRDAMPNLQVPYSLQVKIFGSIPLLSSILLHGNKALGRGNHPCTEEPSRGSQVNIIYLEI